MDHREWARPWLVVLPHEDEGRFLALFDEVLGRLAINPENPLPTEMLAARSVAADLWRYDREADDAEVLKERVLQVPSFNESRANLFREYDDRIRLRGMALESCGQTLRWLQMLREVGHHSEMKLSKRGKVIPFGGR